MKIMPLEEKKLFGREIDKFLAGLSDEAKRKLWLVVNALRLEYEVSGSTKFNIPYSKLERNKSDKEDARAVLGNLHRHNILSVTTTHKIKYSKGNTPAEYSIKNIVDKPEIFDDKKSVIELDRDRFSYLEARLRRIQHPESPFERLVKLENTFDENQCIIASRALRLIAKEIDTIPCLRMTSEMGRFLKSCGVSSEYYGPWLTWKSMTPSLDVRDVYSAENILATMQTPARALSKEDFERHSRAMVLYRILLNYSCGPKKDQEILFRIIENSVHPLLHDGDTERTNIFQNKLNGLMEHAGFFFEGRKILRLEDKVVYKPPTPRVLSPEQMRQRKIHLIAMKNKVAKNEEISARKRETEQIVNETIDKRMEIIGAEAGDVPSNKIRLIEEDGKGFLQFNKRGKKYFVGRLGTRCHKFIQSLTAPNFGVHKSKEAVFEAMRLSKDSQDTRLSDFSLKPARIEQIIETTIKELQKEDKLRGKLLYKQDRKKIWLEVK